VFSFVHKRIGGDWGGLRIREPLMPVTTFFRANKGAWYTEKWDRPMSCRVKMGGGGDLVRSESGDKVVP